MVVFSRSQWSVGGAWMLLVACSASSLSLDASAADPDPRQAPSSTLKPPGSTRSNTAGAANAATAEALFAEGREELRVGNTQRACELLTASQRVERALGTTLLLAHCLEQLGKTASAWALFAEGLSLAEQGGPRGRAELARVRLQALEARLSRLVVNVSGKQQGLSVSCDGRLFPEASWGLPIPVDPGEHMIVVKAPGMRAWQQVVTVPEGPAVVDVAVPKLTPEPLPPAGARSLPSKPRALTPTQDETASTRLYGFLIGGAGLLGLGASVALTASAKANYDESQQYCTPLCTGTGLDLRGDAYTQADWATATAIAGGALTLGGLAWVLVESFAHTETPARSGAPRTGNESGLRITSRVNNTDFGLGVTGSF